MRLVPTVFALALPLASLGAIGCQAEVEPAAPVGYTQVTYGPAPVEEATIESYPHTYYENHPTYLVNGQWWYRDNGRWAHYNREPEQLQRTRGYVQQAPPAGRGEEHERGERGEPVRREEAPASAPPAVRVR